MQASATGAAAGGTRTKKYGSRFAPGFLRFYHDQELTDVIVVAPDSTEYHLHSLVLAYHSDFFKRALSPGFREGTERRIVLGLEDPCGVWPTLVEYFYTDEITLHAGNVLALAALSRGLLVPRIEEYCGDFASSSLEASNALAYLGQAVAFSCDGFRQSCVQLVAETFQHNFSKPTDALSVEVMLEVLQHPSLNVQCEEQVLQFVLGYIRRHTLEPATVAELFGHVNLPFLSNGRLAQLALEEPAIRSQLLLNAMAARLQLIDRPDRLGAAGCVPRKSYCSTVEYGLPGGSDYASVPTDQIWPELAQQLTVQVSGDTVEGDASSILRPSDDASSWFAVSSDGGVGASSVAIEIHFPPHIRLVELTGYSFSHGMNLAMHTFPYGISDSAYFQLKGLVTQVCAGEGAAFTVLKTQTECHMQTEYNVTVCPGQHRTAPWSKIRISLDEDSSSGCSNRLSIRKVRLVGRVEISLLTPPTHAGRDLLTLWRRKNAVHRPAVGRYATGPLPSAGGGTSS